MSRWFFVLSSMFLACGSAVTKENCDKVTPPQTLARAESILGPRSGGYSTGGGWILWFGNTKTGPCCEAYFNGESSSSDLQTSASFHASGCM